MTSTFPNIVLVLPDSPFVRSTDLQLIRSSHSTFSSQARISVSFIIFPPSQKQKGHSLIAQEMAGKFPAQYFLAF